MIIPLNPSGGNSDFKFVQKDSVGASGGILTIWDTNTFSVNNAIEGEFFLAICGSWAGHDSEIAFINVYGPHSNAKKLRLWNELSSFINSLNIPHIVFGDFNEVRNKTECMNSEYNQLWADNFNNFINNLGLIDLPLGGKRFTRICEKTMKFSKLDRFLVYDGIFTIWPNTSSKTLDRDLSDHCPIILRNNLIDSGPKPIRVFDAWLDLKDADYVVERAWSIPTIGNRPDCIFRNKLKNVKLELKKHSNLLDNIDSQIREHLSKCYNWEQTAETRPLSETEKQKWLDEKMQYITKEKKKINMLKQKSRIKWALEGDENSKYFHNYIKRRTNKNNIHGLSINGTWSEDPNQIKLEAYSYFNNIFQSKHLCDECPFDNVSHIEYITPLDNQILESKFNEN
ncbi:uncharacterized protein [Rutidosis leptorrhynchoides]|uniref:uncharacterized protein n=1 Tax=Rutidosis leptorrhynchoides TaxID=125765 RepID=UPI003A990D14